MAYSSHQVQLFPQESYEVHLRFMSQFASNFSEALTTVHDVMEPFRSCSVPSFRLLISGLSP